MESTPKLSQGIIMSSSAAKHGMAAAVEAAQKAGKVMTICVADAGGVALCVERMEGAMAASVEVAMGKAKTAAMFRKPTMMLENGCNVQDKCAGRTSLISSGFLLMGGGLPLM